jgi:hypothetical protein
MSLLTLLSLDDDGIECVTSVVRKWCDQHGVELDSQRGHTKRCLQQSNL